MQPPPPIKRGETSLFVESAPSMGPISTSTSISAPDLIMRKWRRVILCDQAIRFLQNVTSKNKGAPASKLPSSPTACDALLPNPSPTAAESLGHFIDVDEEDHLLRTSAPGVGSLDTTHEVPSPELTRFHPVTAVHEDNAESDLIAPLLHQPLEPPWESFPACTAPSGRACHPEEPARCIGGGSDQCTVGILPDRDEEEEEEETDETPGDTAAGSVRDEHHLDRDHIGQMVKRRNLSFLRRSGGIGKVALVLGTDPDRGIIDSPDDHESNRNSNLVHTKGYTQFLLEPLKSHHILVLLLLLAAAILSFFTGFMRQGFKNGWHDGAVIVAVIFLLVAVPSATNVYKARKLKKELHKRTNLKVDVIRNGRDQDLDISKVVQGELVKLKQGSFVPGDGVLVRGNDLVLDEVMNPKLDQDLNPFLFCGSRVISGDGTMLVVNTVDGSVRSVLEQSRFNPNEPSILEDRMSTPSRYIDIFALVLALLVLLLALVRVWHGDPSLHADKPELKGEVSVNQVVSLLTKILLSKQELIRVFTSSLAAMLIMLQHGVPFAISLSLDYWNQKAKSVEIHNWWASATMGIITILYVDTTCGKMCDGMEVTEVWIGEKKAENYSEISPLVLESLHRAIDASARAPEISATPRNSTLIEWANSMWHLADNFRSNKYTILDFRKLNSDKRAIGTLMRKEGSADEERIMHLQWKGAASLIIEMCSHYINQAGIRCNLLDEQKERLRRDIKGMEERGLVTIGFASREMDEEKIREDGLDLLAIVGLKFICPEQTKSAVRYLRRAGIRVVLVSEDEPSALRSMVYELEAEGGREQSQEAALQEITVMEGLKPKENHTIVRSLKEAGKVVAFYGGSTADVFTLKEADLGITDLDKSTQMAKDCSAMVLGGEGVSSLVRPLELGRCAIRNIQVFTGLQLSTWISWFILSLVMTIRSEDSLIMLLQQIWVNAVMCFLGGLMMRMELSYPGLLDQKPASRTADLIDKAMWVEIAGQVSCQLLVLLLFEFKGRAIPGVSNTVQRAITFTSFNLCQVLSQIRGIKTGTMEELAKVLLQHYWFLATAVTIAAVQVVMVKLAQSFADDLRMNAIHWSLSCGMAVLPLVLYSAGTFLLSTLPSASRPRLSRRKSWPFLMAMFTLSSILLVSAAVWQSESVV